MGAPIERARCRRVGPRRDRTPRFVFVRPEHHPAGCAGESPAHAHPLESTLSLLAWLPQAVRHLQGAVGVTDEAVAAGLGWDTSEVEERLPELVLSDAGLTADLAAIFGIGPADFANYVLGGKPPPGLEVPPGRP